MFLTRDGNLIPVYGMGTTKTDYSICDLLCAVFGRAKVDFSVSTVSEGGTVQKGGQLFLTHNRYSSPTCAVFLLGSNGRGLRSCVLATSYASRGKYSLWDWLSQH